MLSYLSAWVLTSWEHLLWNFSGNAVCYSHSANINKSASVELFGTAALRWHVHVLISDSLNFFIQKNPSHFPVAKHQLSYTMQNSQLSFVKAWPCCPKRTHVHVRTQLHPLWAYFYGEMTCDVLSGLTIFPGHF